MSLATPTRILRSEVLPALERLVGAESARHLLETLPVQKRGPAGKYAKFPSCVSCGKPRNPRSNNLAPECAHCVGLRGGKLGAERRWGHPVSAKTEAGADAGRAEREEAFRRRWATEPEFRRMEGAAHIMRLLQAGGHPPERMLELLDRRETN